MYHRVAELNSDPWSLAVTPTHFADQLAVLRKYGRPISLQQLIQVHGSGRVPKRSIVVTFDDGYADTLQYARPLLEKFDIPATVFITTEQIERTGEFWWDELDKIFLQPGRLPSELKLNVHGQTYHWKLGQAARYSEAEAENRRWQKAWDGAPGSRLALYYAVWKLLKPMTHHQQQAVLENLRAWAHTSANARFTHGTLKQAEICRLAEGKLIDVGAHTVSHPQLSIQSADCQKVEIETSKCVLEKILNRPITSFSYPYGDYTSETLGIIRDAGFNCACSTIEGAVGRHGNLFALPRFEVCDCNGEEFVKKLSRWFRR